MLSHMHAPSLSCWVTHFDYSQMELNDILLQNPQLISNLMVLLQNPGMAAMPNTGIAALLNNPEMAAAMSGLRNASLPTASAPNAAARCGAAKSSRKSSRQHFEARY